MYQLRAPAPALAGFIEHYWFVASTAEVPVDLRVDVFVDGRADLIFNFGAPYERQVIGGATQVIAASNVDAQRLVPIRIAQRGAVRTTGVRFRLGGLGAFARVPLQGVTGATPAPAEVLGAEATALEAALAGAEDAGAQAALLDAFFLGALASGRGFEAFRRALAAAEAGATSAAALSAAAGTSSRQVERLFARYLGFPPQVLVRVLRFQQALRALMADPGGTLAEVALAAGYFDQAHFIKDFRRFSGGVPRGYRGYYPPAGPADFAPNVVVFVQDDAP